MVDFAGRLPQVTLSSRSGSDVAFAWTARSRVAEGDRVHIVSITPGGHHRGTDTTRDLQQDDGRAVVSRCTALARLSPRLGAPGRGVGLRES